MNATKIQAANRNANSLARQLAAVQGRIATATPATQRQLIAQAARIRKAMNVAAAR